MASSSFKQVRFGPAHLPTEWISLHDGDPRPADGFPKQFAYNAIRIPLYIAWAGLGQREIYMPFVLLWQKPRAERPADCRRDDRRAHRLVGGQRLSRDFGAGRPA